MQAICQDARREQLLGSSDARGRDPLQWSPTLKLIKSPFFCWVCLTKNELTNLEDPSLFLLTEQLASCLVARPNRTAGDFKATPRDGTASKVDRLVGRPRLSGFPSG